MQGCIGGAPIFFSGGFRFFEITNFNKNFIKNIYFLLFENFTYRFNQKKPKNIVILFKFNCCGKLILFSSILLKTLITVSI